MGVPAILFLCFVFRDIHCSRTMADAGDHVRGMAEVAKQAQEGLKLFKQDGPAEIDTAGATAFKAAEDEKIKALEEVIKGLAGKDNKKARTEKEKEVKAIKDNKQYIDAEKILKGKEPQNGFFVKKVDEAPKVEEKKVEAKEPEAEKKADKKEKKPAKTESAGISPAERNELEKIKNDIIARKKELKEQGMSGGQINKDEQVAQMVSRMNELKEKECPGSTDPKKGEKKDDKKGGAVSKENSAQVETLQNEIEEYRQKLINEFKYTKKEIADDPDMKDLQAKLNKLKGKK